MRYHYNKPDIFVPIYGKLYICDHPVYDRCTLFEMEDKGLAIIQQRHNNKTKITWWSEIDSWLANDIYLNPGFEKYFNERAKTCTGGLYPTVTVRQIMWALKMKPIPKYEWETVFDRRHI